MEKGRKKFDRDWLSRMAPIAILLLQSFGGVLPSAAGQLFGKFSDRGTAKRLGTISSPLIPESSGLTLSGYRNDLFWTINDSGNTNHLFGLKLTGELQVRVALEGTLNRDWESMARWRKGQQQFLVVAEVGDNLARYPFYSLFFFEEPKFELDPTEDLPIELSIKPQRLDFVYADGARDCEAVGVDPLTGDIWLVEKVASLDPQRKPAGVYRIAFDQGIEQLLGRTAKLHHVQSDATSKAAPLMIERWTDTDYRYVTGMDFSLDGKWLVIRTYLQAMLYSRLPNETWQDAFSARPPQVINLPLQRQGETIAFTNDSQAMIITSEKIGQPIWQIDSQKLRKSD